MLITNGTWADSWPALRPLISTRTPPGRGRRPAFLVPTDTPGLSRRTIHGKLRLRG